MMNESKSELRTSIRDRIIGTYYSFYGQAFISVLLPFFTYELDILRLDKTHLVRDAMEVFMVFRLVLLTDWIIGDDRYIFLSEGAT